MPRRTAEELERAAAEADAWLDGLDPAELEDPADLRRVADAVKAIAAGEKELRAAVGAARANGRTWGRIALAVGSSRQAVQQRFGDVARTP